MSAAPGLKKGEPPWDIARLFPDQGCWEEQDYLALSTNHLVEFSDGSVEVLPMPTMWHQWIVGFIYRTLFAFVEARKLGKVFQAPLRVRLWAGQYREPDVVFMLAKHAKRMHDEYWEGADLVIEVVSDSDQDRKRDLKEKRHDYAKARISEYWIVDPAKLAISVLRLSRSKYVVDGEYGMGDTAASRLLDGFEVKVDTALSKP